ncbi:hypothetical protein ACTFIZ_002353 [Dictyostelium cf. discoideum]
MEPDEADIHAVKNNPTGFAVGDWMPYLVVHYEITKVGSNQKQKGVLMPMVASDGLHYGDNVKLSVAGKYKLKYIISPPEQNAHSHFVQAATDMPTFKLEMNDGKLNPAPLEVPANTKFIIEVVNSGKTAAEFESIPLRKEKVLAPGAKSMVVIHALDKGEYKFFDDFHPKTAQGVIIAK